MKGRGSLSLIKLLLLTIAILAVSCKSCPEPEEQITYARPNPPRVPDLFWFDVPSVYLNELSDEDYEKYIELFENRPGYYGLDDSGSDFDDLQEFFDKFEGYLEKIDNLLKLYENKGSEEE